MKSRYNTLDSENVQLMADIVKREEMKKEISEEASKNISTVQDFLAQIQEEYPNYNRDDVVVVVDGHGYMGEIYYGELSSILLGKYVLLSDFSDETIQCYYAGEELEKNSTIVLRSVAISKSFKSHKRQGKKLNGDIALERQQEVMENSQWTKEEILDNLLVVVGQAAYRNGELVGTKSQANLQPSERLEDYSDNKIKCYWRTRVPNPKANGCVRNKIQEVMSASTIAHDVVRKNLLVVVSGFCYGNDQHEVKASTFDFSEYTVLTKFNSKNIQCYWHNNMVHLWGRTVEN